MAEAMTGGARIYVNGEIVGYHEDPKTLVEELRHLRRNPTTPSNHHDDLVFATALAFWRATSN